MRDSDTIRVIGDPRINPYNKIELTDDAVNTFAPISTGTYMTKTVRHIFSPRDGYLTELELGDDPDELFEKFREQAGTSGGPGDRQPPDQNSDGNSGFLENVVGKAQGGADFLNPFS